MKPLNTMKVSFLSRSANESFARVAVAAFIAQLDPTLDELADIKTAVSEAVTNCIVHAYKDSIGEIYITVKIYENNKVTISVKDKGCGIEDIKKAMEPMYTSSEGGERAGLGFTVMQSFTDRLRVKSRPGFGTTVIMEKKLGKKSVARGT
ncbi:anti-sigma regulatory factor, serine/threonine protein kinase [[Clostridium] cellulosi]|uniref:Anti-sigma F factor n=1 Tax=[Clostridium] cellulosi TaxID=29343 RepID=A0A078KSJ1_9FIRM|nr:anti-sigma regulatory factor, serine/threonine protein kinase [[Clostridium] cellulosi]